MICCVVILGTFLVLYNAGCGVIFDVSIVVIVVFKTLSMGTFEVIISPPSEDAIVEGWFDSLLFTPSEGVNDEVDEGGTGLGLIVGVVSLYSMFAMSSNALFVVSGAFGVNYVLFLYNKCIRSYAVLQRWSFKEACGIVMLLGIIVAVFVILSLCVSG